MKSQISLNRRSAAKHLDKLLDDALEQTFPASDPVAIDFEQFDSSSRCCCQVHPDRSKETAIIKDIARGRPKIHFQCTARNRKALRARQTIAESGLA